MSEIAPGLHSISLDFLYVDMPITDTIYNYNGKVALLAAGEILTELKLERLKKFNTEHSTIAVSKATYTALVEKKMAEYEAEEKKNNPPKVINKFYTETDEYIEFQDEIEDFINSIKDEDTIKPIHVETLHKSALKKVDLIEHQDILKSVNMPRPMDKDLERHSTNVGFLNGIFGKWLYLKEYQIRDLILAGLLHDIGKTKIPDSILNAPRKLTSEEFEIVKMHSSYSYDLLEKDKPEFNQNVLSGVKYHHEKLDGTGYPDKLSGNEIDIFARITAICDVYDALISKRVYKDEFNPFDVCNILLTEFNNALDENLVKLFIQNISATLIGSNVLMSDDSIAVIKRVLPFDVKYPVITQNEKHIMCNEKFYPIKLLNN